MTYTHTPVLLTEVLEFLDLKSGDVVVDATLGLGGHASALVKKIQPTGKLIGIDKDAEALQHARNLLSADANSVVLVNGDFRRIDELVEGAGYKTISGVLFDLGVSSLQLDEASRGFSFNKEAKLDMRMDVEGPLTAHKVVNSYAYPDLVRIFTEYGEEPRAESVAKRIVEARKRKPIETTLELAAVAFPNTPTHVRIHPATKIFQAIRIEVNDELNAITEGLAKGFGLLRSGGRMAVISFHSLEDRIVKDFYKHLKTGGSGMLLTKKAVQPSWSERQKNRRARSARLRVIQKI